MLWPLNVSRHVFTTQWQDITCSNVFHVLTEGLPAADDLAEINACLYDWYTNDDGGHRAPPAAYHPYNTSLGEFVLITVASNLPLPGIQALTNFTVNQLNAGGNVAYPGACALVDWDTAGRGHWRRGRSYVGPVRDSLLAGHPAGRLEPLQAVGLGAAWASLIPRLASWGSLPGRYRLVLRHARPHFPSDGPEGLFSFITSGRVRDLRLRTQDRRVPSERVPSLL